FKTHLNHEAQQLELQGKALIEVAPFMPFAQTITDLAEARRRMEKIDAAKVAATLNTLNKEIEAARRSLETSLRSEPGKLKKPVANRAAGTLNSLRGALRTWFGYYNGYDPLFTWWTEEPYKAVDQALGNYATFLSERVSGVRRADVGATLADARPGGGRGRGGRGDGGGGGEFGGGGGRGGFGGGGVAVARSGDNSDIVGDPIGREGLMVELANEMI